MQKRYIENLDPAQALALYEVGVKPLESVRVPAADSLGMVTSDAVLAVISAPHYNSAAMDGIAVVAETTFGATESSPKTLDSTAFLRVNTGNPVHAPYNAVIMIEDVIEAPNGVTIIAAAHPYQHMRLVGEDIVAGEMIVPSFHTIRAMDIGAFVAAGVEFVNVFRKPVVAIIPTGDEIIEKVADVADGKILDSNSRVFDALARGYGCDTIRYAPVADRRETITAAIQEALGKADIILVNAGTSAGTEDHTVHILEELGTVHVHGVALKPGKPTILAEINGKPVVGIPGYPVSAYIVFETFVKPIIERFTKRHTPEPQEITANLSGRVVSSLKHKEIVRVNLGYIDSRFVATPLARGAGVTMSLVRADGFLEIPRNVEGHDIGESVTVKLLKPKQDIMRRLVSIGSHDMVMDILADILPLSSAHSGSMGGIMALRNRQTHIAPIHLLNEETGEYNISYAKRYFAGKKMALVKGLRRLQGIIVEKGNPLAIKSLNDISERGLTYVNRQRGAGTRLLLDYLLKQNGINPERIIGYTHEENTHTAVAANIKSHNADAGMGVYSAAQAMGLDFIEVGYEDYDFLLYAETLENPQFKLFLEALTSEAFKRRVEALGGYGFERCGEIVMI